MSKRTTPPPSPHVKLTVEKVSEISENKNQGGREEVRYARLRLGAEVDHFGVSRHFQALVKSINDLMARMVRDGRMYVIPLVPAERLTENHQRFELYQVNDGKPVKLHSDCWFQKGLIYFTLEPRTKGIEPMLSYTLPVREGMYFLDIENTVDLNPMVSVE